MFLSPPFFPYAPSFFLSLSFISSLSLLTLPFSRLDFQCSTIWPVCRRGRLSMRAMECSFLTMVRTTLYCVYVYMLYFNSHCRLLSLHFLAVFFLQVCFYFLWALRAVMHFPSILFASFLLFLDL